MKKLIIISLTLVIFLILIGCATTGKMPQSQPETAVSPTIEIKDFAFSPDQVKISAGDTVTWVNDDNAPHAIKFDSAGDISDSSNLAKGESYSQKFDKPGDYSYHCSIHPSMKGKIIVE